MLHSSTVKRQESVCMRSKMSQKPVQKGVLKSAQNVTLSLCTASSGFTHSRDRESAQCSAGVAMTHSIASVNGLGMRGRSHFKGAFLRSGWGMARQSSCRWGWVLPIGVVCAGRRAGRRSAT